MGVSVESPKYLYRLDTAKDFARDPLRLLEPLLEGLGVLDLDDVHWVIVGGESGSGARPLDEAWVTEIRDQCAAGRIPFFFKQWGGTKKKRAGRILDGRTWEQMPAMSASRGLHGRRDRFPSR